MNFNDVLTNQSITFSASFLFVGILVPELMGKVYQKKVGKISMCFVKQVD